MADSDKNILITPSAGLPADPTIVFTGQDNAPVTLSVEADGSLNFSSSIGDLFNITNSLAGILFSVNDANTLPIVEVGDAGTVYLNEFKGNTIIGSGTDDGTNKLQIDGSIGFKSGLLVGALNTATLSQDRTYTLPDVSGTIALYSQIYIKDQTESPQLAGLTIDGSGPEAQITFQDGSNEGHIGFDDNTGFLTIDNTNKIQFKPFAATTSTFDITTTGNTLYGQPARSILKSTDNFNSLINGQALGTIIFEDDNGVNRGRISVVKNNNQPESVRDSEIRINILGSDTDGVVVRGNYTDVPVLRTSRFFATQRAIVDQRVTQIIELNVRVDPKTPLHPYQTGSLNSFYISETPDRNMGSADEAPELVLVEGKTYRFNQDHSSNTGHPLAFYLDPGKLQPWTTGVTTNGTPGNPGAYTEITIDANTPSGLYYQCTNHIFMGFKASVRTTNFAGFNTDDLSEGANQYFTVSRARSAFSQGTGVTISSGQISIGQSVGTGDSVLFNSVQTNGNITVNAGGQIISPSLRLTGVGSAIILNSDLGPISPTQNIQIQVNRGVANNSYIGWDEANDRWVINNGVTEEAILTGAGGTDLDAGTLDGQDGTYYLNYNNFTNTPDSILDFNISDGSPGQVLQTDGNGNFSFTTVTSSGGGGGSGFVGSQAYHFTSSGSPSFSTAANSWQTFQPFVNGALADDADYTANTVTGIVTFNTAPTTGSQVSIYAYNSNLIDNIELLSVSANGSLTVTEDLFAINGNFFGYVDYGTARQGTASFNVTTDVNTFSYTSSAYRGAKLMMHLRNNVSGEEQIQEALILTNGTQPIITSYATIYTGSAPLATYDAVYNAGVTSLFVDNAGTDSLTLKIQYTLLES